MFSLHVKATAMKVSHPIVFGHAVRCSTARVRQAPSCSTKVGRQRQQRMSDLYSKIEVLPASSARRSSGTCQ